MSPAHDPPTRYRTRPLEPVWIEHQGQPQVLLRDRLDLAQPMVVAPLVAVLLDLCDGTRDTLALRADLQRHTGVTLDPIELVRLLQRLDEALVFDSPRFRARLQATLAEYRAAPHRPPFLADRSYPADPTALAELLASFGGPAHGSDGVGGRLRGIVSPHIDFPRGGRVYAETWLRAAPAARGAEVVVIFGTDHMGSPGSITLTRQHYATPWGVLPTHRGAVEAMVAVLGEEAAFREEVHHRSEHSIELAAVWLHYVRGGVPCEVVPVLCGSFHHFTSGLADPAKEERFDAVVGALRQALAGRNVLAVSAADLAHVGPAFGDPRPVSESEQHRLSAADDQLLRACCQGGADAFFQQVAAEQDRRRICGLPPTYLMLRFLGQARGEVVGYAQCPADHDGGYGSLVTIAGVLLR